MAKELNTGNPKYITWQHDKPVKLRIPINRVDPNMAAKEGGFSIPYGEAKMRVNVENNKFNNVHSIQIKLINKDFKLKNDKVEIK